MAKKQRVKKYERPGRPKGEYDKKERNSLVIGAQFPVDVANRIHEICAERGINRSKVMKRIVALGLPLYEQELERGQEQPA